MSYYHIASSGSSGEIFGNYILKALKSEMFSVVNEAMLDLYHTKQLHHV